MKNYFVQVQWYQCGKIAAYGNKPGFVCLKVT